MKIYELARELGQELLKTPETERLLASKKAYEVDPKAMDMINEYNTLQSDYQQKMSSTEFSQADHEDAVKVLTEKADAIKEYPVTAELMAAETEFNKFMNSVFSIVTSTMAGDSEDGCGEGGCDSGCCSSCGGGCH